MKLENTIVVIASLGELKIFDVKKIENIVDDELKDSYNLELIRGMDFIDEHKRISEVVSDKAGNFNGGTNDDADNLLIEQKKKVIKKIAKEINDIAKSKKPKQLLLSFAKELSDELMGYLNPDTKAILTKVIYKDLVNSDKNKILSYFI